MDVPGAVTLWDVDSGTPLRTLLQHPFLRGPVASSGDGSRVAATTCTPRQQASTASVWEADSGKRLFATPLGRCGKGVDLSPTGRLLAASTEDAAENVKVWDIENADLVAVMTHRTPWTGSVQFSPDGERLLTTGADGTGRVWDADTGEPVLVLDGHTGPVEQGAWTADGSTFVTASLTARPGSGTRPAARTCW